MTPVPPRHVLVWPQRGVEMAFRLIPAGSFRMGSRGYYADEEPIHRVWIPRPFWMAETPVTQAQFALWTKAEKIKHDNEFKGCPDHPAESLDWGQAADFCTWLGRVKAAELPKGFPLARLPTEAEWEYACRAGTDTEYYTGDGAAALAEAGWFGEEWGTGSTHPVRQKQPNAFGLYDLHGNVLEWCQDVYDPNAYRKRMDGWEAREWTLAGAGEDADYLTEEDRNARKNRTRVLRGGSWNGHARICRSAYRNGDRPDDRRWNIGLRVCLVRGPATGRGAPTAEQAEAKPAPGDGGCGTRPESDGAGAAGAPRRKLAISARPREAGRKKGKNEPFPNTRLW